MVGWTGPGSHGDGWVVPLFADGVQGAGASSGKGILVRRDGVEEWRPDAAVVGWAAGCDCDWREAPWTRVARADLADPAARLLYADLAYLDEPDEALLRHEWEAHVAPLRCLEELEEAAADARTATARLDRAVAAARAAGASWAEIGRGAGMTRQSANERWSR